MSDRARTSPYLVLGVEFGSSVKQATRAFAKRQRELAALDLPIETEDLTWALSQFKRPDLRSDLSFLRAPVGSSGDVDVPEGSLFRPGPIRLSRTTEPMDDNRRTELEHLRLREVIAAFFDSAQLTHAALYEPSSTEGE